MPGPDYIPPQPKPAELPDWMKEIFEKPQADPLKEFERIWREKKPEKEKVPA